MRTSVLTEPGGFETRRSGALAVTRRGYVTVVVTRLGPAGAAATALAVPVSTALAQLARPLPVARTTDLPLELSFRDAGGETMALSAPPFRFRSSQKLRVLSQPGSPLVLVGVHGGGDVLAEFAAYLVDELNGVQHLFDVGTRVQPLALLGKALYARDGRGRLVTYASERPVDAPFDGRVWVTDPFFVVLKGQKASVYEFVDGHLVFRHARELPSYVVGEAGLYLVPGDGAKLVVYTAGQLRVLGETLLPLGSSPDPRVRESVEVAAALTAGRDLVLLLRQPAATYVQGVLRKVAPGLAHDAAVVVREGSVRLSAQVPAGGALWLREGRVLLVRESGWPWEGVRGVAVGALY